MKEQDHMADRQANREIIQICGIVAGGIATISGIFLSILATTSPHSGVVLWAVRLIAVVLPFASVVIVLTTLLLNARDTRDIHEYVVGVSPSSLHVIIMTTFASCVLVFFVTCFLFISIDPYGWWLFLIATIMAAIPVIMFYKGQSHFFHGEST